MSAVIRYSVALLSLLLVFILRTAALANNIAVSSIALTGQNTTSDFTFVRFNLSWENSWRFATGPANWDAAWVFAKFRVGDSDPSLTDVTSSGTTVTVSSTVMLRAGMPIRVTAGTGAFASNTVISSITNSTQFVVSATPSTPLSGATIECIRIWEHARLHNTGHTAPTGSTIEIGLATPSSSFNATSSPVLGVFLYRRSAGSGNVAYNGTQLRWNYGANGLSDEIPVAVQVFAIEMVYVPGGVDSNVGGGVGSSITTLPFTSTTINTRNTVTAPSGTGSLGGQAGGYPTGQTAPDNAGWPNGYNAFYCMKHEVSQGQYRDFLNTLTYTQQATRTINSPNSADGTTAMSNSSRNDLVIKTPGVSASIPAVYASTVDGDAIGDETNDGEHIPMNQIDCRDLMAILDWAGLRPMTELEFEKAARGTMTPVIHEYAWGTVSVTPSSGISRSGETNEIASNAGANASFNGGVSGPMRVGSFASSATTRAQAGASYFGIPELTGSQSEHLITVALADGRVFDGLHGNGVLDAKGDRDVVSWPETAIDGKHSGLYIGLGFGVRGGSYINGTSGVLFGTISSRGASRSSDTHSEWTRSNRCADKGGCGVRTAQ